MTSKDKKRAGMSDSNSGKSIAHFYDLATRFVGQVRRAFEGSGPRPVFNPRWIHKQWVLGRFIGLDMDLIPKIYYPFPKAEDFMTISFQRKVNSLIRMNPILLAGVSDMRFKLKDGRYAKISNVHWKVEVYKLRKLEMNGKGVIAITQFAARSK